MADAISREQMRRKLTYMLHRLRQRRDGPYKVGYRDACNDALQKLEECDPLELNAVTRCRECAHATERQTTMPYCTIHNRRRAPDDYCNFGEHEF